MRQIDLTYDKRPDRYLLLESDEVIPAVKSIEKRLTGYLARNRSWSGGNSFDELLNKIMLGDETLVAASEAMLEKIEDQVPMSKGYQTVDDVVGAFPNIPAYLAGQPMCMRRRKRVTKNNAPLVIYMDLTSSAGIDAKRIQDRGTVLLALVRLLCDHRAVELWVGTGLGGGYNGVSGTVAWRIDTAPLDLARAAFRIASTSIARGFGYEMATEKFETGGGWPLGDFRRHQATAKERLANVFEGQEILYVPPIFLTDEMTTDPVGWVKRTLKEYVGGGDDE
jgi:hypothetical protein